MSLDTKTKIQEVQEAIDKDGNSAHAATDERLEDVRQQGVNRSGLQNFAFDTQSTDPEQMPNQDVPDGVDVSLIYYPTNSGVVWVGDADAQEVPLTDTGQAVSLAVDNTNALYIQTPNVGDGVTVVFER